MCGAGSVRDMAIGRERFPSGLLSAVQAGSHHEQSSKAPALDHIHRREVVEGLVVGGHQRYPISLFCGNRRRGFLWIPSR